jgi:hypothetical protein
MQVDVIASKDPRLVMYLIVDKRNLNLFLVLWYLGGVMLLL